MANLTGMNLDVNVKENTGEFEVLPAGKYVQVILSDELRDNSKKTGKILEIKWQTIRHPQYDGVVVKEYLNIINASPIAQEISQGTLRRLCTLTSVPYPPAKTELLYGKPILNTIKIEEFVSNNTSEKLKSNKITAHNEVPSQQPEQPQENASCDHADEKSPW
ncbi:MAG: hypothetical protein ACT6FC_06385 [Methanosarcinaceae archaeon]